MKKTILVAVSLFVGLMAYATETKIIVRAKAKDAKFVGSSLGGAYVIIKDASNQRILAEGRTEGSTGNTNLIMKTPKERYTALADEGTAKFLAVIDIDEPTYITIEIHSPNNNKQASATVSTQLWLIPGKDIVGDGIIVEVPGFIIDVLKPRTHQYIAWSEVKDKPLQIEVNMVMMCGCTISDGGLWDANKIEVKGLLKKDGVRMKEVTLSLASVNLFEGEVSVPSTGLYELIVYAYDPVTGNTGVDKVNYIISE